MVGQFASASGCLFLAFIFGQVMLGLAEVFVGFRTVALLVLLLFMWIPLPRLRAGFALILTFRVARLALTILVFNAACLLVHWALQRVT